MRTKAVMNFPLPEGARKSRNGSMKYDYASNDLFIGRQSQEGFEVF
jgi:hypothetical protein